MSQEIEWQVERASRGANRLAASRRVLLLADHRSVKLPGRLSPRARDGKNDFYYARCLQLINIGLGPRCSPLCKALSVIVLDLRRMIR